MPVHAVNCPSVRRDRGATPERWRWYVSAMMPALVARSARSARGRARGSRARVLTASCSLIAAATAVGCAPDGAPADVENITFTSHVHILPVRDAIVTRAADEHPDAHLTYHGGKVIQAPRIVQVLYGAGTYIPELTDPTAPSMASAYGVLAAEGVYDWLGEYDTDSPRQQIRRAQFERPTQITPLLLRNRAVIRDADVQSELAAQIQNKLLLAPDDNTVYMVHFAAGTTNVTNDGLLSCSDFCAYHGTFRIGRQDVYYSVLPDLTSRGCATGCGTSSSVFDNQTAVASHELLGCITDPEIEFEPVVGPPLAWYDGDHIELQTSAPIGEIADICSALQGTYDASDGHLYTFQRGFSNQRGECILMPSIGEPAGYRRADGSSAVVRRDASNRIQELRLVGTRWVGSDLTTGSGAPIAAGRPAAYQRSDGQSAVVFRGTDDHIYELALPVGGATWAVSDVTRRSGTAAAAGDPSAYVRSNGASAIVFRGTDNHIYETIYDAGGWVATDLTAVSEASEASGNPIGYSRSDQINDVLFRAVDNHIHVIDFPPVLGGWISVDLTALVGVPEIRGDPVAQVRSDQVNTIVFRGVDNHVYELHLDFVVGWLGVDLSLVAGAPAAIGNVSAYVRGDNTSAIVFRSADNHIQELYLASDGRWRTEDLTGLTGAPAAAGDPAPYVRTGTIAALVFRDENNHIRELSLDTTGWSTLDLTRSAAEQAR